MQRLVGGRTGRNATGRAPVMLSMMVMYRLILAWLSFSLPAVAPGAKQERSAANMRKMQGGRKPVQGEERRRSHPSRGNAQSDSTAARQPGRRALPTWLHDGIAESGNHAHDLQGAARAAGR